MEPGKISFRHVLTASSAVLLVECFLYAAASRWPDSRMLLTAAGRSIQFVLTVLFAGRTISTGLAALGLARSRLVYGAVRGLFWSAAFGALCGLAAMALYGLGVNPLDLVRMPIPKGREEMLLLFSVGALISPIAEELFFRGLVFGFFRRWGTVTAVAASTGLFALAHLPATIFPLTQVIGGLLFAAAYEHERSLAAPITIHVLGNTSIFTLSLVF